MASEPFLYLGQSRIPQNVTHVKVHPSVKVIREEAFAGCNKLMNVELCEGLERITGSTFSKCSSLQHIRIPLTVKVIGGFQFYRCRKLMNV